ncbi:MAG: chemotaxis protein CheW [Verrucomicrobiota bacterium]
MEEITADSFTEKNKLCDIYGSFLLAENEFALPVQSIREVVNEPANYSTIPLSPDYLLGLFNLRGMIIPVVDLRKIFNLDDSHHESFTRKVAIIEYGDLALGLLFDKTGEVFNGNTVERSQFHHREGVKESIVEGVFKFEGGERIVQILDSYELLNLDKIPCSRDTEGFGLRRNSGKRRQCISFKVGDALCAFNIHEIQEIVKVDKIDNTALSHACSLGAINIRGNTVPVIDFGIILGMRKEPCEISQDYLLHDRKVIVMKLDDELFSLLVDSIESIVSYFDDELAQFPLLGSHHSKLFLGCISKGPKQNVILLDHREVLSDAEIEAVTRGHSDLYKNHDDQSEKNRLSNEKRTLITFSISETYALEMSEVQEIIEHPEEVMRPPNLPHFIDGIVNLRDDIIPMINPRTLYAMDACSRKDKKILVFMMNGDKYGLIVDSVDSIVTFSEHKDVKLPQTMYSKGNHPVSEIVKEVLQVKMPNEDTQVLMIMNLTALASKTFLQEAA